MSLKDKVIADLKDAMKAKDTLKMSALRNLKSEIERNEQGPKGKVELTDDKIIPIIKKMVEGIKETTKNEQEIAILDAYLPQQLTEAEIKDIMTGLAQDGKLPPIGDIMKHFKANFEGRYDGKTVSTLAKDLF